MTKKCGLPGCNITIEHYHSWEQPPTELDLWVKVPHSVALTVGADNHALAEQIEQLTRERDEARRDCLNFKLQGNIAGLAPESRSTRDPDSISEPYKGPIDSNPLIPSWCKDE